MHQDSLLLMIMPVLGEVAKTAPTDPEKKRALLGLCEKPSVSKVLNSFMFDYLLLPYGSHPSIKSAEGAKDAGVQVKHIDWPLTPSNLSFLFLTDSFIQVPPGLSEYAWKRVAGETVPTSESVEVTFKQKFLDTSFDEICSYS